MDVILIEKETNAEGTARQTVIRGKGVARSGLFNPSEVEVTKTVNWTEEGGRVLDHPRLSFQGGASRTLTLALFFDSCEGQQDVRTYTNKVAELARYDGNLHRPPVCRVYWGPDAGGDLPFRGVVTRVTQRFTLFLANGTPVRATVDISFREYEAPEQQARRSNTASPDRRKTRVVAQGDSLWSLAAAEYDDPAQWRPIADANNLDNPRQLTPGMILSIPALEK